MKLSEAAAEEAKKKNLSLVSGLCWRYDYGVREMVQRVLDGAIGEILAIQRRRKRHPHISPLSLDQPWGVAYTSTRLLCVYVESSLGEWPCARREIVCEEKVGVYHCLARYVRRASLCGEDANSHQNFDHRKDWIQARLEELAGILAIEVGTSPC